MINALLIHGKIPENGVFVFPENSKSFEFGTFSEWRIWNIFRSGDKVLTLTSLVLKWIWHFKVHLKSSFKFLNRKTGEKAFHLPKFSQRDFFEKHFSIRFYQYESPIGSGVILRGRQCCWEMSIIRWERMEIGQTYHRWLFLKWRSHGWYNGFWHYSSADERLGC